MQTWFFPDSASFPSGFSGAQMHNLFGLTYTFAYHELFESLGLRTFLTTGEKETRAWTFRAGSKAPECAGRIHTDLQRRFIRAEVIQWDELIALGSWKQAREMGKLRVEGKEYEFVDGDVTEFLHGA